MEPIDNQRVILGEEAWQSLVSRSLRCGKRVDCAVGVRVDVVAKVFTCRRAVILWRVSEKILVSNKVECLSRY